MPSKPVGEEVVENDPRTGDEFLLFHRLPFDFSAHLPIHLLGNVYLDETPDAVLDAGPRERGLASFVLPGYGLVPTANCCLRYIKRACNDTQTGAPSDLFFMSIDALRLQKPLCIEVGGQFRLGVDQDLIEEPQLFHLTSSWQPKPSALYDSQDIAIVSEIANRLLEVLSETNVRRPNLAGAVTYFSQVTAGLVRSRQLAYLGLWASLEALFLPHNDGEATLARRVSTYLSEFDFSVELEDWVKSEYRRRRNAYAHGLHVVQPWKPDTDPPPRAFGILHEIVRLCILGFLGMDKQVLLGLQNSRKADLKRCLDGLSPASCRFLDDQVAWLDSKHLLQA